MSGANTTVSKLSASDQALVLRISHMLNASLDLETVLAMAMEEVSDAMDAEAGSVFLVEEHSDKLSFYVPTGEAGARIKGLKIDKGVGVVGHVVNAGKSEVVGDTSKDPRFLKKVDEQSGFNTRNLIATPLRVRDRIIGALEVLNRKTGTWSERDLPMFETLAQPVALAVDNAQLYTRLTRAYARLEQLDKMKADFIAVASHELRTPLTSTKLFLEMLLDGGFGALAEEQKDALSTVDRNVNRLVEITSGLTNLSELNRKEVELSLDEVKPHELLREAARQVRGFVAQRRQRLVVAPCERLGSVRADSAKAGTVLQNLLLNAIRFTPDEGELVLSAAPTENFVQFSVEDTGIGVEPENQEQIFKGLYEVIDHEHHSSGTIEFMSAGMGLGLAIAKGIVEAHGGKIWCESEGKDQGSVFHFTLPKTEAQP